MFQAEIPAGICRYKENEKGEAQHLLLSLCVGSFSSGKK